MDLIFKQPIPYKSVEGFMYRYFRDYYLLNSSQKWHYLRPIFALLTLVSAQSLMLFLYEPPSTMWLLINHDIDRLTALPVEVNLIVVSCYFQAGYYLYVGYLEEHSSIAFLVHTVTGSENRSIFICKAYQKGKGDRVRRLSVSEHIRKYCSLVLGSLQVFILAIGKNNLLFF